MILIFSCNLGLKNTKMKTFILTFTLMQHRVKQLILLVKIIIT
jgi:hypothetical protein